MSDRYYYSAQTGGFYRQSDKVLYEASSSGWPDDAVVVSEQQYQTLLDGQASGKVIKADNKGNPILSDPIIDWHASAESQRQILLTEANAATADWRTELQLNVISDEDKTSLIKWMAYIKALKAVDLSSVKDEVGFNSIAWPDKPSF